MRGVASLVVHANIDQFTNAQMTEEGLLMQGADLKPMFQDFNMHVEFRVPYMPEADGQARGNSGLYLQSRYECQILDSFALDPLFNGLGSLYRFKSPDVNMALPPLTWQTYDVDFTAARFDADDKVLAPAKITVRLNGIVIHQDQELSETTTAAPIGQITPEPGPIFIQHHGNPVYYRNIWIIPK